MRFIKIVLICIFSVQFTAAQDTTIVISSNMFDNIYKRVWLSDIEGWECKQGDFSGINELNGSKTPWKKLLPYKLDKSYADENGRVDCWFRVRIQIDESQIGKQIAFGFPRWAATDFYIDGELKASRGNTGNEYKDYLGGTDPYQERFLSTSTHVLTYHFVGYLVDIPLFSTKFRRPAFMVFGSNYVSSTQENIEFESFVFTSTIAICTVLALLFWMIYFQNRKEESVFWIALHTTLLAIAISVYTSRFDIGHSFTEFIIYNSLGPTIFLGVVSILTPILLTKIFKRKLSKWWLITLCTFWFLGVIFTEHSFLTSLLIEILNYTFIVIIAVIPLYYIVTSWKTIKGAQWAVVVGLFLPILIFILFNFKKELISNFINPLYVSYLEISCSVVAFPLALLVYVSLRFKEINKEVQLHAEEVLSLVNEKKERAENQQKVLEEQVTKRTNELQQTVENLKSTQAQLIQSEKLASLGELTAGISHEIQNPLNFVNNFAEVTSELAEELIEEANNELEARDWELEKEILNDIKQNLTKIGHHGSRASSIVQGMLAHSRSRTDEKELTNIPILADEYLRLAFHGLRAKDRTFNANFKTNFGENIPDILTFKQDIGRVLLNLINNAFQAVAEKQKKLKQSNSDQDFQPEVVVSVFTEKNAVIIKVSDNGMGVKDDIKEKIFQPFYTTKPTGEGTGLGLSLAYNIINKGHNGSLTFDSKYNEGTTFSISLPF